MPSQEITEYYDSTERREIRSDLAFAVNLVGDPKIAIDCGCGAGADIKYLFAKGFKVYGFDIEEESISRCKKRFKNNQDVILSKAGFSPVRTPKPLRSLWRRWPSSLAVNKFLAHLEKSIVIV